MDFDVRSPTQRILRCAECWQPVVGEPSGRIVSLHCGYCGKDDAVELEPEKIDSSEQAYRGRSPATKRTGVVHDLSVPPEGLERFKRLRTKKLAELESIWRDTIAKPQDDMEWDRRLAFLGAMLAFLQEHTGDSLRARATTETTLLHLRAPSFRAILLARLANLASRGGSPELAEKWLAMVPEGIRVAEVQGAVKTARALVLRTRGDIDGVLAMTADEFVPPYKWLAVALRMDAFERRGDRKMAYAVWQAIARNGGNLMLANARLNGLAPITRKRINRFGFLALGCVLLLLCALYTLIESIADHSPIQWWLVVGAFGSFVLLMIWRRLG